MLMRPRFLFFRFALHTTSLLLLHPTDRPTATAAVPLSVGNDPELSAAEWFVETREVMIMVREDMLGLVNNSNSMAAAAVLSISC